MTATACYCILSSEISICFLFFYVLPSVLKPIFLQMELFSNDQSQLSLMDAVYLLDSPYIPSNVQGKHEEQSNEFCLPSSYYNQHESIPFLSGSSLIETFSSSVMKSEDSQLKKGKQSIVKRLNAAQPKSKSKCKRTRKSCSEKKVLEETKPVTDYIHVRARRGQATDSHSLAERVRRERISEMMKILQDLVPGCEKVTGKALILEEIINYVQSLKIQVESLSMRLALQNPILYEFGLNFEDFTGTPEHLDSNPQLLSSMIQFGNIQRPADSIMVMDSSSTTVLCGLEPTAVPQDAGSYFMQVDGQTGALDHQDDLYSMSFFQQN